MLTLIRDLWDSAVFRGIVLLCALGFAPFVLLSLAVSALSK
jgi:hypothetical protein